MTRRGRWVKRGGAALVVVSVGALVWWFPAPAAAVFVVPAAIGLFAYFFAREF